MNFNTIFPSIYESISEEDREQLAQLYHNATGYSDYLWGKSRTYLMPYWSTKYSGSQITENIFISDLPSAFNREALQERGITHVVNMIIGVDSLYPNDFVYKNIPSRDIETQDLQQYFQECIDFINEAIRLGGKVLVHCSQGISRSATIVIAYLISEGMTYEEACQLVKEKRSVTNPNPGFRQQLMNFAETQ